MRPDDLIPASLVRQRLEEAYRRGVATGHSQAVSVLGAGGRVRTFSADSDPAPTHAGLCVRAADTGRVLMLRRAATPGDPAAGMWEFPGGGIGKNGSRESARSAARREWAEEVGRPVPDGMPGETWQSGNGVYVGHVWEVPTEAGVDLAGRAGDRGEEVAWRNPGDLSGTGIRRELAADAPKVLAALGKWQNTRSFSDAPASSSSGLAELAVAMMEAYADGDTDTADALADLADDPDGLAELVADIDGGTHGIPGRGAFSALVKQFADGVRTFAWAHDPTKRSKTRITDGASGRHAYGKSAERIMARQGRRDRGEPEPAHPARQKAQELKAAREPAREKARTAWSKVVNDPGSLTADDFGALREHLDSLTRDEVRAEVKRIRGGGHGGKLKSELIDALRDHARGAATDEHMKGRPKASDQGRLALAGLQPNPYKIVTADGEEIPPGKGFQRWEGNKKVGYTPEQAEKVAAGLTPDHADRRIAEHENAANSADLDEVQRDYHAEMAAQLRDHKERLFPPPAPAAASPPPGAVDAPADGAGGKQPHETAGAALLAGKSFAEWQEDTLQRAYDDDGKVADPAAVAALNSMDAAQYIRNQEIAGKPVVAGSGRKVGVVTGFTPDLRFATVRHDDGTESTLHADGLNSLTGHVKHELDKGKNGSLKPDVLAHFARVVAKDAHDSGRNISDVLRDKGIDPAKAMSVRGAIAAEVDRLKASAKPQPSPELEAARDRAKQRDAAPVGPPVDEVDAGHVEDMDRARKADKQFRGEGRYEAETWEKLRAKNPGEKLPPLSRDAAEWIADGADRDGKPVPPEVLADYPDLAPTPTVAPNENEPAPAAATGADNPHAADEAELDRLSRSPTKLSPQDAARRDQLRREWGERNLRARGATSVQPPFGGGKGPGVSDSENEATAAAARKQSAPGADHHAGVAAKMGQNPMGLTGLDDLRKDYGHLSDEQWAAGVERLAAAGKVQLYGDASQEMLADKGIPALSDGKRYSTITAKGDAITAADLEAAFGGGSGAKPAGGDQVPDAGKMVEPAATPAAPKPPASTPEAAASRIDLDVSPTPEGLAGHLAGLDNAGRAAVMAGYGLPTTATPADLHAAVTGGATFDAGRKPASKPAGKQPKETNEEQLDRMGTDALNAPSNRPQVEARPTVPSKQAAADAAHAAERVKYLEKRLAQMDATARFGGESQGAKNARADIERELATQRKKAAGGVKPVKTPRATKPKAAKPTAPAAKPAAHGTAGEAHPLGQTPEDQRRALGSAVGSFDGMGKLPPGGTEDDPLGHGAAGFPAGVDRGSFEQDVQGVVGRSQVARAVGASHDELYNSVGKKYGLSQHEFARAMHALHDLDTADRLGLRGSGWSQSLDRLPAPGVATMRGQKIMNFIQTGTGSVADHERLAGMGDQSLNVDHPAVKQMYGGSSPKAPAGGDPAAAHAATLPANSPARKAIEAAVANGGGDKRRTLKELGHRHAEMHAQMSPAEEQGYAEMMGRMGAKPLHAPGETKPFDPETMQSDSGISTGTPVKVTRRGWTGLYGDERTGHELIGNNYQRAQVEPAAAKPAKTKPADGGGFSPEAAVKVAADDVARLRKPDVFRVIDWSPPEHRQAVADYIRTNRPELADEVADVMSDYA
jgi:8-oxo-dGTP pyrophosphatase MutT (NUDIX family)/alkylhydroperoxidase family enzyme